MSSYLSRRARVKGLLGGSRPWTLLWAVLLGARVLRRVLRDKPDVVFSESLAEGETLVITTKDRKPRVSQEAPSGS